MAKTASINRPSEINIGLSFDMLPLKYNKETLAAMQEARDIASGKIKTKSYSSVREMIEELEDMED